MSEQTQQIKGQLVEICHRLSDAGFVTATDGNVSVRLENGNLLATRTSVNKGMVTAEDLVETDKDGLPLVPGPQPSTELGMHVFIYSERPDVNAVVHAHPICATGFATARRPLTGCLFPEVIVGLGAIPLAEYATPSTEEVAASLLPYVKNSDAVLLANHGVVAYGKDLWDACFKMEKVEHAARIALVAHLLGGEQPLSADEVAKLQAISQSAYGKDFSAKPRCEPASPGTGPQIPSDEEIREVVRQMIQKK